MVGEGERYRSGSWREPGARCAGHLSHGHDLGLQAEKWHDLVYSAGSCERPGAAWICERDQGGSEESSQEAVVVIYVREYRGLV